MLQDKTSKPGSQPLFHLVVLLLLGMAAIPASAAEVDWTAEARVRWEGNDAPTSSAARETDFDFTHLRARVGVDVKWTRWSLHGALQGAATYDLPENGSFGIGPVYFNANGERNPSHVGLVELALTYKTEPFHLTLGRQKWADGVEVMTGVPYLDGVKKARLGERLLGNWDWVNVGRRFDGVSLGWNAAAPIHVSAFAFTPLAGGVNYDDAFDQLDALDVSGVTVTGRYGESLSKGEWRLFAINYEDTRLGAFFASGGAVDIQTFGASLLLGDDHQDLLIWVAVQSGDWGLVDQDALAYIVELGRKFTLGDFGLAVRVGLAEASGDDAPNSGDHETFFNLLPTNHKWYGAIDYNAFQNLRDLYADFTLTRGAFKAGLGLHRFDLVEENDAWYGGSGAFNEAALGFAARRPAAGRFADGSLASEIDFSFGYAFKSKKLDLAWGWSWFESDDAAEEIVSFDPDGNWMFVQLSWKL